VGPVSSDPFDDDGIVVARVSRGEEASVESS